MATMARGHVHFVLYHHSVAYFTMCAGVPEDYEVPLQGMVPPDPSFEDMRRVVVVERRQPPIPPRWSSEEVCVHMYLQCFVQVQCAYIHVHLYIALHVMVPTIYNIITYIYLYMHAYMHTHTQLLGVCVCSQSCDRH